MTAASISSKGQIAIPDAVRDGPVGFVKVVDSWAMVAWLSGEPSAPLVGQFILDAEAGSLQWLMSLINAAETLNILARRDSPDGAEVFLTRL